MLILLIQFVLASGNLYCGEQNCTTCIPTYVLVNTQCLSFCPTGYTQSGTSCTYASTTMISVNFLTQVYFTQHQISTLKTPNLISFNDPSLNAPIPTVDRGFYFGATSQLINSAPFSIGYQLSVNLVFKILQPGIIFQLTDVNNLVYITATACSQTIDVDWLLFDTTTGENITYTTSTAYSSKWYNYTIIQSQYNDYINLFNFYNSITVNNYEFRGDTALTFTLGSLVTSFQGFIARLMITNNSKTLYFTTVFPNCDYNEYYIASNTSCNACNSSYPTWPWCVRDSPVVCYIGCSDCIGLGYSGCTACEDSTRTPPGCNDGNGCTVSVSTFSCSACATGLVLIGGLCVNEPYLYDASTLNTPVINLVFDTISQCFGPFQSGANAATYSYNNMEADDPLILKQRGLYINKSQFIKTSVDIVLNYQFTMAMWVQFFNSAEIFYKDTLTFQAVMQAKIVLSNPEKTTPYYQREQIGILCCGTWELFTVYLSFASGVSNLILARSKSWSIPTYSVDGFALYDIPSPLYLGSYPSTDNQQAFIYSFQLWNTALSATQVSSIQTIALCPAVPISNCLIKCSQTTYYNEYMYACMACPSACVNGCTRWDSCNFCSNMLCTQCTDFFSACTPDASIACISPTVLSGSQTTCCHPSCLECYESNSYQCTSCVSGEFLLSQICVTQCPIGYLGDGGNCVLITTEIVNFSIQGFKITGDDYFTTANSGQYYPVTGLGQALPALNRGYYFTSTTSMASDAILLSYNLTFVLWIKQMQPGIILQKNLMHLTSNSTNITFTYSSSIKVGFPGFPNTDWNLLSLQYSSNMVSSFTVGISYPPGNYTVQSPGTYMMIDSTSSLILGDASASFTGFIYSFQIYNTLPTTITSSLLQCNSTILSNCLWDCDIGYYWSTPSCVLCKTGCTEGCIGETYCNLCADPICYDCSDFYAVCSQCKSNAAIVGSSCECNGGYYWDIDLEVCAVCSNVCLTCSGPNTYDCTSCANSLFLLAQICVDICPIGYQEVSGNCVLTVNEVVDFTITGFTISGDNYFTTANSIEHYPVSITSQPLPALNRGYYFSSTTTMSSDTILLSYNLTFVLWIKQLQPGIILQKDSMYLKSSISSIVFTYSTLITASFPGMPNTHWNLLSLKYSSDYISNFTVGVSYPPASFTVDYPGIFAIIDTCSSLVLGDYSSSFVGFIYSFQIYNTLLTTITSSLQQCTSTIESNCLWNCDLSHYWSTTSCLSCKSGCTEGCIGGTYCNLCNDPICSECTEFYGTCNECKSNAALVGGNCECNVGYSWNPNSEKCTACSYICLTCSGPNNDQCTSCANNQTLVEGCCECVEGYYQIGTGRCRECDSTCKSCILPGFFACTSCNNFLLESVCIDICPVGYFNIGHVCYTSYNSSAAVHFDFSTIENSYYDEISGLPAATGNDSSFYPSYRPSDPIAAIDRGLYFTGSGSYLATPVPSNDFILFGLRFYITMWINPFSLYGNLLYKADANNNNIFSFSLIGGIYEVFISMNSQLQVYSSVNPLQQQEWSFIMLSLDYSQGSYFSINTNNVSSTALYLSDAPFVDILNSVLSVGAYSYNSPYYTGFIYEMSIYTYLPSLKGLVLSIGVCGACNQCSESGICFSTCNITAYPISNSCSQCPESCETGCRNGESCSLCTAINCLICSNYAEDSCTQCDVDYELVNKNCVSCNSTSYYNANNFSCIPCGTLCSTCEDGHSCSTCVENSSLTNTSTCQCDQGYTYQQSCIRNLFYGILEISTNNSISIIFSEVLENALNTSNMMVIVSGASQNFTVAQSGNYTWNLTISFNSTVANGAIVEIQFIEEVTSVCNSMLVTNSLTASLFGNAIDPAASEITNILSYAKNGLTFGVASSMGMSAVNMNPTMFFNFLNSAQIYSYISLYQIEVDPELITFLMTLNPNSMLPNLPQLYISSSEGTAINQKFSNFGYSNNLLIVNSGINLSVLVVIFALFGFLLPLKYIKINWVQRQVDKMKNKFKFAVFLRFWIQSYFDFLLNSAIGLVFMAPHDSLEYFDLFLCCLMLVIIIQVVQISCTLLLPYLIINRSRIVDPEYLEHFDALFSTLFEEFNGHVMSTNWYYLTFISRRVSLALCILFVKDPLVQLVVSAVFCLVVGFI